jgi:hypothetical protein
MCPLCVSDEMNCVRAVTLDIWCVCSLISSNFINHASPRFSWPHMTDVVASCSALCALGSCSNSASQ